MKKDIIVHVKENPATGSLGAKIGRTYFFFGKDSEDKEKVEMYHALAGATAHVPAPEQSPEQLEFIEGLVGSKMDWNLLRKQKRILAGIAMSDAGAKITHAQRDMAEGLLNLLDFIMDNAVDTFGKTSMEVFGKKYPSLKDIKNEIQPDSGTTV